MIPIEKLVTPPNTDQIFAKLADILERAKVPAKSWPAGGVARSILGAISQAGAIGAGICASIASGTLLYFATGDWLTNHAEDVYDCVRYPVTFATGPVTITNGSASPKAYGPGELVVYASGSKARFVVTDAITLAAGASGTFGVRAVDAGAASTVQIGEIDSFETPLSRVTVTNPSAIIGRDAESDDDLKVRCRAKKGTWSVYGPRDAYVSAALEAKLGDGSATSINRVVVSRGSSNSTVTVICATPSGTPTADELAAVRANVEAKARPDGTKAIVIGASTVTVTKTIRIWARGGVESILRTNATKAINALITGYPIGGISKADDLPGYLFDDLLEATIVSSSPETFDVDFVSGAGDVLLDVDDVPTNAITFEVRIR